MVSYSCSCTAEDVKYEMRTIVLASLPYDFENFALCCVVQIDKKETENGGDVWYCYLADYFCQN